MKERAICEVCACAYEYEVGVESGEMCFGCLTQQGSSELEEARVGLGCAEDEVVTLQAQIDDLEEAVEKKDAQITELSDSCNYLEKVARDLCGRLKTIAQDAYDVTVSLIVEEQEAIDQTLEDLKGGDAS